LPNSTSKPSKTSKKLSRHYPDGHRANQMQRWLGHAGSALNHLLLLANRTSLAVAGIPRLARRNVTATSAVRP